MKERRRPRIATVSGLALLAGGTAIAAVAGGAHSIFATLLLGLLALGMGHALLDETRRQAQRRTVGGWAVQDTVNVALLSAWAAAALLGTVFLVLPLRVHAVVAALTLGYALICGYFVIERCRMISDTRMGTQSVGAETTSTGPNTRQNGCPAGSA